MKTIAAIFLLCHSVFTMGIAAGVVVFGEGDVGSLAGGSGWAGAGILGLVLVWIAYRHLPDKDKQIMTLIQTQAAQLELKDKQLLSFMDRQDKKVADVIAAGNLKDMERREDFKDNLKIVTDHCSKEMNAMWLAAHADSSALRDAINTLAKAADNKELVGELKAVMVRLTSIEDTYKKTP